MNTKALRPRRVAAWVLACTIGLGGCASNEPEGPTTDELFAGVRLGMTRGDVDALLGPPVDVASSSSLSSVVEAWYLPPPPLEPTESPYAKGTIGVTFSSGKVVSKRLNPQYGEGRAAPPPVPQLPGGARDRG
jgi:hypothetical protein